LYNNIPVQYLSWQPFRKDGSPGKWTKIHKIKDRKTLCGLTIPQKLEVFDYSSEKYAGDGCKKCWKNNKT